MADAAAITEEQQREEILAKLSDQHWRLNNLYFIQDKDGVTVKFKMNESQQWLWDNLWYLNTILKDRQRGFSTFIALYIFDTCFWNEGIHAGIIDITLDDAKLKLGKISFAYANLPNWIKAMNPCTRDARESMEWFNTSTVQVGTSHRGGTLQILHTSELGKIAARFPERSREIKTGAYNTVSPGNMIFVESTAEGNAGDFYDMCMEAQRMQDSGTTLTKLDFKFHFFGWWMGVENEIDPEGVYISTEDEKYFARIEKEIGITLSDAKKAWYIKKSAQQGDDMKREYPGTPAEAFEAATKGAYLQKVLLAMRKKDQLTRVPIEPGIALNSGWDYGLSDTMTIWIHQRVRFEDRLVGYLAGEDDDVLYYWSELQRRYAGYVWGTHFVPHDFDHRRGGTSRDPAMPPKTLKQILTDAGMANISTVPRTDDKRASITEVRNWLPKALMDENECKEGLKCLMNYRREWDEIMGTWKERPRHDWASHGYDSIETLVRGLNAYGVVSQSIEDKERQGFRTKRRPPPDWRYH